MIKNSKLLLLWLITPLLFCNVFADDPHYEQLYDECSENLTSYQNQYTTCVWELSNVYETLSWLEYLTFNLYWFDNDTVYSVPLTNDVYLPIGYRAVIDSGVVLIEKLQTIENAYSLGDNDFKDNVVSNYGVVYLFLVSSGLFLILLYAIRRYFIWLKSIK